MKKKLLVWIIVAVAVLSTPLLFFAGKSVISSADLFEINSEVKQENTVQKNDEDKESETVADKLKEKLDSKQEAETVSEEDVAKQNELLELNSSVQKNVEQDESLSSAYAGEYLDGDKLVICVTDKKASDEVKEQVGNELSNASNEYVSENNVEYKVVKYSKETLDNTKKALDDKNATIDKSALTGEQSDLLSRLVSYGVDYKENCVGVGIQEYTEKDKAIFESIFGVNPCLKYYEQESVSADSIYKPGQRLSVYELGNDGSLSEIGLSLGYKAFKDMDGNGVPSEGDVYGFTTCAHGIYERESNMIFSSDYCVIGIVYENGFELDASPNKLDYSFIKLFPSSEISGYTEYENRKIESIGEIKEGITIWKEGNTEPNTEVSTVGKENTTVVYNKSYPDFTMIDIVESANGLSKKGDSGGIVYRAGADKNYQAVGIVSGGTTNETAPKEERKGYFVRADRIRDKQNIYVHSGSETNTVSTSTSGNFDGFNWEFKSNTLYISGSGSMPDFYCAPWSHLYVNIRAVVIDDGITSIGDYAFYNCTSLESVTIGKDVTSIGYNAFAWCNRLESVTIKGEIEYVAYNAFYKCNSLSSDLALTWVQHNSYNMSGRPSLDWKPVVGAVNYEVLRSGSKNGVYSVRCTTTENRYMDFDTEPGTDYYYKIKAIFSNGTYTTSSSECVECRCASPMMWVGTDAATGRPIIEWDEVSDATKYMVGCKESPYEEDEYIFETPVNGTSFVDTSAAYGSTYHYTVRAVDKQGNKSFSKYYEATCNYPRPTGLSVVKDTKTGNPKLTWQAVEEVPYYSVEVSKDNGKTYESVAQVEASEYIYTDTEDGYHVYYFRVRAVDSARSSAVSIDYYEPTNFIIKSDTSTGKPKLAWNSDSQIDTYYVYRSDSLDGVYTGAVLEEISLSDITEDEITFVDNTAQAGKIYYYRVYAEGSSYNGYTKISDITCKLYQPVTTIKNNESNGKPEINWSKIEGAYGYRIYRSTNKYQRGKLLHTMGDTTCIDYSAEPNKIYYYSVQAFILKNNPASSAFSESVSIMCNPIASVTVTIKNNEKGAPYLMWKSITGTSNYKVFRAEDDGVYKEIGCVSSNISTYTDNLAVPGNEYYYKIESLRRINANEVLLAQSAEETCICKCEAPKLKVASFKVSSTAEYARLSFGIPRGAKSYMIYRSTDNKGYKKIAVVNERYIQTYTDETVEPGVKYYYKVRAVPANGNLSASAFSNIGSFIYTVE